MRDLVRSLRLTGKPVPVPWPSLGRIIRPRAGSLMAVTAAPGVGKSMFALEWAAAIREPVLYISLDTSLVDHAIRLTARTTGRTVEEISEGHDKDLGKWIGRWEPVVSELDYPVRFFDLSVRAKDVGDVVAAETAYWGEPPLVTIVDNAGNLLEEQESAQEYARIFRELHKVAREQNTLVIALHHLRRKPPGSKRPCKQCGFGEDDVDQSTLPVHSSDILYGGDREVQFLLGLWRPYTDQLRVGVLKNRMGAANPNGGLAVTLDADFARARLDEAPLTNYRASMGVPA